jgi:hypothetical protein
MPVKIEVEKSQLANFKPSEYCQWCVTISTTDPAGLGPKNVYEWAIDLPADTDILDPDQAKLIKGAPKYKIDPSFGGGKKTRPGQQSIKICFVAACKERRNTEISLERRINPPPGDIGALAPLLADPADLWERVPFDGGPNGLGKIPGPAAIAFAQPNPPEAFGFLASFEAAKLNALLGLSPRLADLPGVASRVAAGSIRVVSGEDESDDDAGEPSAKPPAKPAAKRRKR